MEAYGPVLHSARLEFSSNNRTPSIKKPTDWVGSFMDGAPGEIRTPDRSVRSRVLYPAELQAHNLKARFYGLLPGFASQFSSFIYIFPPGVCTDITEDFVGDGL